MTIIQIITELEPAGAERVVADLSTELKKSGHDISVVSLKALPEKNSQIVDELKRTGVSVHSLCVTKLTPWRIFRLLPIIRNSAFNCQLSTVNCQLIVHSHLIHANIAARIIKLFCRKFKLINTIHIAERRKKASWHFLLDRITLPLCDCLTAVSRAAGNYHASKLRIPADAIQVVYNGIRPPAVPGIEKLEMMRMQWGVYDCTRVIGAVGRLNWQKGYDILFRVLHDLSIRIHPGETWGVVILGDGPQRKELEEMAAEMPGNIKISMPGFRPDASSCMAAFNLFVMPSRYEGFGLSMAEAICHGIPVLSSDTDSLPELLSGYSNGKAISFSLDNTGNIADEILSMAYAPPCDGYNLFPVSKMAGGYYSLYLKMIKPGEPVI